MSMNLLSKIVTHIVPVAELDENDIKSGAFVTSEVTDVIFKVHNVSASELGCELLIGDTGSSIISEITPLDFDSFVLGEDEDRSCE